MKRTVGHLCAVGLILGSGALFAPPAVAAPCDTYLYPTGIRPEVQSYTVGVLGQPVATTPYLELGACVSANYGSALPTYHIDDYGDNEFALWLDLPAGSARVNWVQVDYTVGSSYQEHQIPVGVGGGESGRSVCVAFRGRAGQNPGGCLVFLEH